MWKGVIWAFWEALKKQWFPVTSLCYYIRYKHVPADISPLLEALKKAIIWGGFVLVAFAILYTFAVSLILASRRYVYYRLIPPEKGKYQLGLWVSFIQHLNSETTPHGFLSVFRLPPDYSLTFSEAGLILTAPKKFEARVVDVLARQSSANRIFVYEKVGEDPPFSFKKVLIRWIRRSVPKLLKDYQETESPVEKQVEKQAVNDPTEAIVERFAEFIVQKDPAALAYTAALKGEGKLQIAWMPVWKVSVWQYPLKWWFKVLKESDNRRIPDLAFVRIRVEQKKEGVMDAALIGEELGFNWRFSLFAQYFWSWLWRKRANKGTFGAFFLEKFSLMYPQEMAIWSRLPIRFSPEILATNKLPSSLLGEAVFKVPWGEPTKEFLVECDALCHEWREKNVIDGTVFEPLDVIPYLEDKFASQIDSQETHMEPLAETEQEAEVYIGGVKITEADDDVED